jgi:hypothetical protein
MILNHLDASGRLINPDTAKSYPSYRELIHKCTENHRWDRFGEDLLLGIQSDKALHFKQQEFPAGPPEQRFQPYVPLQEQVKTIIGQQNLLTLFLHQPPICQIQASRRK